MEAPAEDRAAEVTCCIDMTVAAAIVGDRGDKQSRQVSIDVMWVRRFVAKGGEGKEE